MISKCAYPIVALAALTACSGGDAEQRVDLDQKPEFASAPIDSPDITGAGWSRLDNTDALSFGKPGTPLFSIVCNAGSIILTRHAPADPQASALMPLIGNGKIVRLPVNSVAAGEGYVWQGQFDAADEQLNVFIGSRSVEATVPGAGTIDLAASPEPGALITRCRQSLQQPRPQQQTDQEAPPPNP